jgi:hypothetical protein
MGRARPLASDLILLCAGGFERKGADAMRKMMVVAVAGLLGGMLTAGGGCETQQISHVGDAPREAIAYAATAKYPAVAATAPAQTGMQVAAVDDTENKKVTIMNLTDNAIPPATVWVNGAYLHRTATIAPRGMASINYSELLMAGPSPQDLKASGQSVRKVELQTHDGFFTVQGPSKKAD